MILEYSCKNFKSIKDEITFSMIASDTEKDKKNLMDFEGYNINKISAIYGANGSGKSNLLKSIIFLCNIIKNNIYSQPGDKLEAKPHKLSELEKTEYRIQFIKDNNRYLYGNAFTKDKIFEEYLYCFDKEENKKLIFKRENENYKYGDKYKEELLLTEGMHEENKFLLSVAANNTKIDEIKKVFLFFKEDICILGIKDMYSNNIRNEYFKETLKSKEMTLDLIRSLNKFGINVKEIVEKRDEVIEMLERSIHDVDEALITEDEKESMKIRLRNLIRHSNNNIIEFNYGPFSINAQDESEGTKLLFQFLPLVKYIIDNDKILIWDEIESSLHPSIIDTFIESFFDDKSKSQLIFSTHNINLLDSDLLSKDQIWFTDLRGEERTTDLYSLDDFVGIGKNDNIRKEYLKGRYGAIPDIKKAYKKIDDSYEKIDKLYDYIDGGFIND